MADPRLYSTPEIAEIFGIKESYLRKQRQLNQGPRYFKLGRKPLYRYSDVEQWLSGYLSEIEPNCNVEEPTL